MIIRTDNFLFFSDWNMFSAIPISRTIDFTCDQKKTFLFKDTTILRRNPNFGRFFRTAQSPILFNEQKTQQIGAMARELMNCNSKVEVYQFEENLFSHIFLSQTNPPELIGTL